MNESFDYNQTIQRYIEGEIDVADFERLSRWIESDPGHARHFLLSVSVHRQLGDIFDSHVKLKEHDQELAFLDVPLQDTLAIKDALAVLLEAEENLSVPPVGPPLVLRKNAADKPIPAPIRSAVSKPEIYRPIVIPWWVVIATGIAAAIGLTAFVLPSVLNSRGATHQVVQSPTEPSHTTGWSATVVGRAHSSGDDTQCTYTMGERIAGPIRLGDESIEVQLSSGTVVVVVGPFEGNLISQRELDLASGKVVVDLGNSIGGFVVTTPHATYRDIGTVFGVTLGEGLLGDVTVLDGEVVAEMISPTGTVARQRVLVGESARIAEDHAGFQLVPSEVQAYPRSIATIRRQYRDQQIAEATVAFWRFEPEDVSLGRLPGSNLFTNIDQATVAVPDISGNGNHLFTGEVGYLAEIRDRAPEGLRDSLSIDNRQSVWFPATDGLHDLHTWSSFSRPRRGADVQQPDWDAFTIEFSFRPDTLRGPHTILGFDGEVQRGSGLQPAFACELVEGSLVVKGVDGRGRFRAIRPETRLRAGQWVHVALVGDGATLRVYLKRQGASGGYELVGESAFSGGIHRPASRTWDGMPQTWTLGRGIFDGKMGRTFHGYIDEVRICRMALEVDDFLFQQ